MARAAIEAAAPLIPPRPTRALLREIAAGCTACDLYKCGTQTVFGEGRGQARAMLVGEQPGDSEDKAGRPFVGPAGKLLDKALLAAGIDRKLVYVTNVVKHFKWVPRGKRRLHERPNKLLPRTNRLASAGPPRAPRARGEGHPGAARGTPPRTA